MPSRTNEWRPSGNGLVLACRFTKPLCSFDNFLKLSKYSYRKCKFDVYQIVSSHCEKKTLNFTTHSYLPAMPRNRKPSSSAIALNVPLLVALVLTHLRELNVGPKDILGLRRVSRRWWRTVLEGLPRRLWWCWASYARSHVNLVSRPRHGRHMSDCRRVDWYPVVVFFKITAGIPVSPRGLPREIAAHLRAWRRWKNRHLDDLRSSECVALYTSVRQGESKTILPPATVRTAISKNNLLDFRLGKF